MRWRDSGPDRLFMHEAEMALADAPMSEGGWPHAIDLLARATWSRGANFVCLGSGTPSLNLISGFDQQHVAQVLDDPAMWGPGNWRVGTTTQPFEIQHDEHYRDYRANRPLSDYDEAVYELDMQHGFQTIFSQDVAGFIGIAVLRSRRDGPADPDSVARFNRLSKAMARGLMVEMALAGEGIHLALGQMERVRSAMFLVNRHGWACGMSDSAEAILEQGRPVWRRGAQIALRNPLDNYRFQQVMAYMLRRERECADAVRMRISGEPGERWTLSVAHLPSSALALGFQPHVAVTIERVVH